MLPFTSLPMPPAYYGVGGAPLNAAPPFAAGYTNTPAQVNNMSTNIANGVGPAGGGPNISPTTIAQLAMRLTAYCLLWLIGKLSFKPMVSDGAHSVQRPRSLVAGSPSLPP
jgi:hypothetical protein